MCLFKWTPRGLNIFDKNAGSQPEGAEGSPDRSVPAWFTRPVGRLPAPAAPRCLTTMDLLLLCILLLFCINKVNTPFKLNAPPGDWMADPASFPHLAGEPGSSSDFNLWLGGRLGVLAFHSQWLPEGAGGSWGSDPPGTRTTGGDLGAPCVHASPWRAGWIRVVPGSAGRHHPELPGPPCSVSPGVTASQPRGPCRAASKTVRSEGGPHRDKGPLSRAPAWY